MKTESLLEKFNPIGEIIISDAVTKKSAREVAIEILHRVDSSKIHVDYILNSELGKSGLAIVDRALITEIVNGTLRWRGKIDWILGRFIKGKITAYPHTIKCLLEISLYQIFFLNKIPQYAVVNEAVEIAKHIGGKKTGGLVNAVLRNIIRNKDQIEFPTIDKDPVLALSVLYSHPQWLVRRWLDRFGIEETIALLQANNRRPSISLRINTLKTNGESLLCKLDEQGLRVQKCPVVENFITVQEPGNLQDLALFESGLFTVQDASAGLASLLLQPKKGETIVDMCAAPGGKTTHLAELMKNTGTIIAVDKFGDRLSQVRDNCQRLGIENVFLVQGDALTISFKREVDRILVDAPCSGLGVLAKRPDLRWRRRPQEIEDFARLQFNLLLQASDAIKRGGVLVYSTCTTEAEENELVVERFLHQRRDFVLEDAAQFVTPKLVDNNGYIRTFPHQHGMDGSFAARLVRM